VNSRQHYFVYRGEVFELRPAQLFSEPRHNTWAAIVVGVVGAGISGGMAASGAGQPTQPNLAASSAQLANAQAELLPIQRALEAAAQQGTSTTVNMPAHTAAQQMAWVPGTPTTNARGMATPADGQWVKYNAADWQAGGKYASLGTPKLQNQNVKVPAGPQTFDFKGYGAADVQGKLANSMAQVQLALSQKYDSQFIDQSLQQEKLADPQGFAARQKMNDLVQEQINRPLNEPVADELNRQVQSELTAAKSGTLDPQMHDVLMQGGSAALNARGGGSSTNTPDFAQPLTTGAAGTRRQLAAIQAGTTELGSGQTPEDIAYRREQQNLANLSSFMNNQTPTSQFKSLSGAQTGPTPFAPGQTLPQLPNNGNGAQQAAINSWQTQLSAAGNQSNPWMAGLSSLLGAGSAAIKSGAF
jgi:hypothetical protein